MLAKQLSGAAAAAVPAYIEDVFSTWLYTGNGSTQTITNGIDLAGKGGLVWIKNRGSAVSPYLYDTARTLAYLQTDNTNAEQAVSPPLLSAFTSSGFTVDASSGGGTNFNNSIFASWTFRKQAKFFDVVTYTGTGANRTVAHNLGSVPGCIIVKRTDTTSDWQVYHRSLANTEYLVLNSTAAKATGTTRWNSTTPTSTVFSLGTDASVNANGGTYVAYLFAHDAGGFGLTGSDNVISCGSFTTNSSGNVTVDLGWEPQWLLWKPSSGAGSWFISDTMRGLGASGATEAYLIANSSQEENTSSLNTRFNVTSTGFSCTSGALAVSATHIYLAIRRGPMKTPTDATKVFQPTVYTGTNVDNRLVDTTIAPDMVFVRQRNDTALGGMVVGDRLRGQPYLLTGTDAVEVNDADAFDQQIVSTTEYGSAFSAMNGFWCGNDATAKLNANTTSNNHIAEAFKRAPGFFDVVCYTGTGSATTVTHNLGVVPEMIIVKRRGISADWAVYSAPTGATNGLYLNANLAQTALTWWNDTTPTSSVFSIGTLAQVNSNTSTYVAYLFATCAGVSKVGSYTGNGGSVNTNGTSQTINCSFTAGSRFVLIKRTDSTGDWYVFDSARGIVAASDPYLRLNSTGAEVTTVDAVDTDNSGFVVNQTSGTNLNVTNATYIFLAIA